jgi:hypothetical protein
MNKQLTFVGGLLSILLVCLPHKVRADEVTDLVKLILETSPQERAKASAYKAKKQSSPNKSAPKPSQHRESASPALDLPPDHVFDVSAKLPKDIVGKYVYGQVTMSGRLHIVDGVADICFVAKNGRGFFFEFTDPILIERFSKFRNGEKFVIPKDFPLKVINKTFTAAYWVRLPL